MEQLPATLKRLVSQHPTPVEDCETLYRVWYHLDSQSAHAQLDSLLLAEGVDPQWPASLIRESLRNNPALAAETLLTNWHRLSLPLRIAAIEPLSSSAAGMTALVAAVKNGTVQKDLVNTNQLRKWTSSGNTQLTASIESVWGKIRQQDNQQRQALVASTLDQLKSNASGSASGGLAVFTRVCAQCHQLHGQGLEVGPNITGNGRGNLEQLVSNVLDPSLVIGEAFQAKLILTVDGEVMTGLVVAETDRYVRLKVQGGKIIELDKADEIEEIKASSKSLMPEGLESQLTQQELFDLFAYLCLVKPLDQADNEWIPGTPEHFVKP